MNDLLLLSGIDIPFQEAQISIHQPTIKEIAYIGEEAFFNGCSLLNFSKELFLNDKDKVHLEDKSNFEVFMSIMIDKRNSALKKSRVNVTMVLSLMFPEYQIQMNNSGIVLIKNGEKELHSINNLNFEAFKEIISSMFCLKRRNGNAPEYNPEGEKARQIAEKLRKGRLQAAAAKGENVDKIAILSRYTSILAVGENKDMNALLHYTVYQLFDEFDRFCLKQEFDTYFKLKLAGAQNLEEVDNWMKDIH